VDVGTKENFDAQNITNPGDHPLIEKSLADWAGVLLVQKIKEPGSREIRPEGIRSLISPRGV
jgi:hypothetical protein